MYSTRLPVSLRAVEWARWLDPQNIVSGKIDPASALPTLPLSKAVVKLGALPVQPTTTPGPLVAKRLHW